VRLDRLLSIVITLLNRDRITAPELAEKLGVTVRTIYRDIEAIGAAGVPVVAFPGNAGGYGIQENYRLDRQLLTLSDLSAMLAALKGIGSTLRTREIERAIEKVGSLVPREKKGVVDLFGEQIALDMSGWVYDERWQVNLRRLLEAIQTRRLVRFVYRNLRGGQESRVVEPMTLLYKGSSWYLFGYCRLREDYRIFHTRRMSDPEVQLKVFERRAGSFRDFLAQGEAPNMVDLVLRFPATHRLKVEELFPEDQISQTGAHLVVRARFPEDEWVYGLILGYGDKVEVLEPASVRDRIALTIRRMGQIYPVSSPNLT
jgi:predicted DNA-binding transcriptional regulator YafY